MVVFFDHSGDILDYSGGGILNYSGGGILDYSGGGILDYTVVGFWTKVAILTMVVVFLTICVMVSIDYSGGILSLY